MPFIDSLKAIFRSPSPKARPWEPLFFHPSKRVRHLDAPHIPLEEEFLAGPATAERYFPVHIGDTLLSRRFQVIGKLGFGRTSTVWLARDFARHEHAALKILTRAATHAAATRIGEPAGEALVLERIRTADASHAFRKYLRAATEEAVLQRPDGAGEHALLVETPMAESWRDKTARLRARGRAMDVHEIKHGLRAVLRGLVYLHETAGVVHTDINSGNVLIGVHGTEAYEAYLSRELADPSARKELPGGAYTVYVSRSLAQPAPEPALSEADTASPVVLGDFGSACFTSPMQPLVHSAQPRAYRAPEVMVGVPWSVGVDIWNVALFAWYMVNGVHLFSSPSSSASSPSAPAQYSPESHLVDIISVLGLPPADVYSLPNPYFSDSGQWKGAMTLKPHRSLAESVSGAKHDEKDKFVDFVRMALAWRPQDRATARELLDSPWLHE